MQSQTSQNEQETSLQEFTSARHLVTHSGEGWLHTASKVAPLRFGQRAATRVFAPAQVAMACGAQPTNRPPPQMQAPSGLHFGNGQ